jgi:hypothetical protein
MYGDALTGGQNQIVALNAGAVDGMERGHVLALWRAASSVIDKTDPSRRRSSCPTSARHAVRVPRVRRDVVRADPVGQGAGQAGDRFTQP